MFRYFCRVLAGISWGHGWWGHYATVAFKWFDINPGDADELILLGDLLIFDLWVGLGRDR